MSGMGDTHRSIIGLDAQTSGSQILYYPSLDEGALGILKPHIALSGKVIFAFNATDSVLAPPQILFRLDEGGRKGA